MINHQSESENSSDGNTRYLISTGWQKIEWYDPYRGGQTSKLAPGSGRVLIFKSDGTIEQENPNDRGTWQIKREGKRLKLELNWPQTQTCLLQYEIRELSAGRLRIAWQGRHGMVEETYERKTVSAIGT